MKAWKCYKSLHSLPHPTAAHGWLEWMSWQNMPHGIDTTWELKSCRPIRAHQMSSGTNQRIVPLAIKCPLIALLAMSEWGHMASMSPVTKLQFPAMKMPCDGPVKHMDTDTSRTDRQKQNGGLTRQKLKDPNSTQTNRQNILTITFYKSLK